MVIKLVTFDALYTTLAPRLPIYVQYANTFRPYLGTLQPDALKRSFKTALRDVQKERPAYAGENAASGWWGEVIKRTAIGAGADPRDVDSSLGEIVPRLLKRFSSREGYKLYDDTIPALKEFHDMNIRTAMVSNTDARMRLVLDDLQIASWLNPIILSEEAGIEKPNPSIFSLALRNPQTGEAPAILPEECVHVGDELESDYYGAKAAGMHALLLRRASDDSEPGMHQTESEALQGVEVVRSVRSVLDSTTSSSPPPFASAMGVRTSSAGTSSSPG